MLMPSIFGEDLFDDWMRLPVERENHRGYRGSRRNRGNGYSGSYRGD